MIAGAQFFSDQSPSIWSSTREYKTRNSPQTAAHRGDNQIIITHDCMATAAKNATAITIIQISRNNNFLYEIEFVDNKQNTLKKLHLLLLLQEETHLDLIFHTLPLLWGHQLPLSAAVVVVDVS